MPNIPLLVEETMSNNATLAFASSEQLADISEGSPEVYAYLG